MAWTVADVAAVTPHFNDLGKYIGAMESSGWTLMHVDNGKMFFHKGTGNSGGANTIPTPNKD